MATKLAPPVKMPRFTTEEFREMKAKYVAKWGYKLHIPDFDDVFKYDLTPEPSQEELRLYKKGDVAALGEVRYAAIQRLMNEKREKFMRMLASPTPDIVHNISSIMTTLDDINDVLGTIAMVGRIAARFLPKVASKFITGPAGWALLGADIANIGMELSRLPFAAHKIQAELHNTVKDHPLSKKAKLCRLNKLKRLRLSKGEVIEALQTTENMFGIGISLGPLMGLVYDIPAALYHHIRGEKVAIKGKRWDFLFSDRVWANNLRSMGTLFVGLPPELDQDLTKSMIAANLSTQLADTVRPDGGPIDAIENINGIAVPARTPEYPSTRSIIEDELGDPEANTGWVYNSKKYIEVTDPFNFYKDTIQENVTAWRKRNTRSTEGMVGAQNAIEAGLNIMGNLNDYPCVLYEYDCTTNAMLKLMNQGYRYPTHATTEQVQCFHQQVEAFCRLYGDVSYQDAQLIGNAICGFEFTTHVPGLEGPTGDQLQVDHQQFIRDRAKDYTNTIFWYAQFMEPRLGLWPDYMVYRYLLEVNIRLRWLQTYTWQSPWPSPRGAGILEGILTKAMARLNLTPHKHTCLRGYNIPVYDPMGLFDKARPC